MASNCWLCRNCTTDEVKSFHAFMVEKAHCVDAHEMAAHMRDHLEAQKAESELQDEDLPTAEDIQLHIKRHVLHPSVRVAQILRNLLDLADTLQELVSGRGEDGLPLVDVRTVTVYLKVISEIMQIYKTADLSKMLFAELEA
jgi:hypothetical protein